ncbi:MAG: hypothetical protein AB8B87_12855 [Granulosicoccus sp.]
MWLASNPGFASAWPADSVEKHFVARIMQENRSEGKGDAKRVWMVEGGLERRDLAADL